MKKKLFNPKFSIITVVLNNEKYIEETIKSVIGQRYQNFEYIIIDGKSSDNTISTKFHFEIWGNQKKLNPEKWLVSR